MRRDFQNRIGGVSRLFTSGGRSVQQRIEACSIETSVLTIKEKDITYPSSFTTLQAALDCITTGTEGNINLIIPNGNYIETLVLSDSSSVNLTLSGEDEPQFGYGFQSDKNVIGPSAFGTGVTTITTVGSTITIANSGDAPDLTLLNIEQGDTILIQNDGGVVQRRTISSVTADTITVTSNLTLGATPGSGFVFLPRVHITGSIDTASHAGKFTLKDIFVSSADGFGVKSGVAPVCLENSVIHTVEPEAALGALFLSGAAVPRSDLRGSALFGSRGLTVERIHGSEAVEMSIYVVDSTQDGWAIHLAEGSVGFLETSHIAGHPNSSSILLTTGGSQLDVEATEITVATPTYDARAVEADLNSSINIHDGSSVHLVDPVGAARHASAVNISKLTICGDVELIGNSVLLQRAVEAINGGNVVADDSNITFTDIQAGSEYIADATAGAAPPLIGATQASVLDKI